MKKSVEEVEKEFREFRAMVAERERTFQKSEELRREWFKEANRKYFTPKRVVRRAIEEVDTAIILGKKVSFDKIIRKIEEKVSPDAAKQLRDVTTEVDFAQRLRSIERAITNAYREDKLLQEKLSLAKDARKLSLYYRGKVVEELKRRGEWKPMTLEELREQLERHKNVIKGGA